MANFRDFEFETTTLSSTSLESNICDFCRIGEPRGSGLGWSVSPSFFGRINISAEDGRVECNVSVTPIDSSNYNVKVTKVTVTGTRKKPYRR